MEKLLKIYVEDSDNSRKWYDLYNKQDHSTLDEKLLNEEELYIVDYEADFDENLKTYDLVEIIEIADELSIMNNHEYGHIMSYHEVTGCDIFSAIQEYKDSDFYHGMTMEDVAYEYIKNLCGNENSCLLYYFDYATFAIDMNYHGYTETNSGVVRIY